MVTLIAYLFMFAVIGVLKLVITILCIPIGIIKALLGSGSPRTSHSGHDDVPRTEYDEFDWWQDNQGL